MSRYITIVGPSSDVTYDEMIDYIDATVASGVQVQGLGGIITTTISGITYIDGTPLIAEDGDVVDGGEL